MPEQEVDDVLSAVAARLTTVLGKSPGTEVIKGVSEYQIPVIPMFPWVVLNYLDTPWVFSGSGRNNIRHKIEVISIVAPLARATEGRKTALALVRDVKNALTVAAHGGLELIAAPNQTSVMGQGSQWLRNVLYPQGVPAERQNTFLASGVIFEISELTLETF